MLEFHTPIDAAKWLRSRASGTLHSDSRKLRPGDGFIAWPGAANDARKYVTGALGHGAQACLVEQLGVERYAFRDQRVAAYAGLKAASGLIAAAYFEHPSEQLDVLAVTGTNGKTSTVWWLAQALSKLKLVAPIPCAMVGTLGIGRPPAIVATGLTTPDPVLLQQAFRRFAEEGVKACAMEVSSIGIEEQRLAGTRVRTAIFTNLTQDHLDYHGSMAAYWHSKAQLFAWPGLKSAVINIDDPQGAALAGTLAAGALDVWTVSCIGAARLQACDVCHDAQGLQFTVQESAAGAMGGESYRLQTRLIGLYNVSNLLGVMAAMRSIGVPLAAVVDACAGLTPVPGRMEVVSGAGLSQDATGVGSTHQLPQQPLAVVDYAHTPDALDKALLALQPVARQRGGQLWCVFGCGGDRDATKRPLMGAIAARHADHVVVTSDNPRSEKPEAIISQILLGLTGHGAVTVAPDRALAIAQTLAQAAASDVLLIAGKGHEDYQEVAGRRLAFSDQEHVRRALHAWLAPAIPPGTLREHGMLTLEQARQWLGTARLVGRGEVSFRRVHSDTRTVEPGDLFVALRGERFDANDFLLEAKAKGAVAALCQGDADARLRAAGLPGLVVADAKLALAALATKWRAQFKLPLIAVTGSNGKTTVTQMIAAILSAFKPEAFLATQGNLNNDIGVPLTVLRLRRHHELAVIELGMNHPGEISVLAAIAQPTVALVNNAQREHLEFMATVAAVAQENGAVIDALPDSGVAVFPSDDRYSAAWATRAGQRAVQRFCISDDEPGSGVEVRCREAIWLGDAWQVTVETTHGPLHYALHIAGLHNVKNSTAAIACALAAGVPLAAIAQGLAAFEPVKGRSRALVLQWGAHPITLVDDSYNANPDSVRAAIEVLAALPGRRLLVLGDMGEVGDQGPQFHAEVGALARSLGVDRLFTFGDLSVAASTSFGAGRHFGDMDSLRTALLAELAQTDSVLVKGSRFMKMERLVDAITTEASNEKWKRENHAG
ncbi:MAG: bifunctional UDP-N-acetylmuramoyl-L-alanyl-D-glutamate--2,6-diaminopimelate ligase MurE/UDP-N-acetylmuramoyl-tripeptide--D-alanyl-D-alanine ligase MurF [Rhodoferax sp.]|uniref:bifunctional UDP-N-acetylmuramoyl-L-alanyl-D-glutamate--2, 6-diaminopimelate ligase MurE/UDP-N-acetylmuramoyl-tripeptide--D-alanyl-D-alanine ligase MurF n=1 Tax=Rhodoferax sp. TaxID=50421 RepID=UPI0026174BE7|nr:bifunctional UDP-N-acetylmuramoyl-L-alanyl-D-glutamate--2,6-diaminopimelate ligase MurE/UDP-N-acetylmuramoyl-tripeptide--D-alanyl-D-alanine ligase MurF [Rhodoferax sp.]MDD5335027.1 bifunctional UDP-N-acetylmuramoyl-L-alanyl-D-glutamate--2,6-diaminopimelate ligase MurE/UDP-N-acetylmuramoyl-tripeptide--D-alanyl-D-alanine ligase MurF [Rhodoferax sp.]